ncbi:GPP34 family phosphoprotein [Kitasatospora sp. NPDC093806]|uniref:GOLPH3/VPS74 family protein n=1 Tax=Kitasatospora sp. NPDC093806 TaxID=3155075 RepID=UPI00344847DF
MAPFDAVPFEAVPPDPVPPGGLSLPEELVLLCTDPEQGLLRVSSAAFQRVIAGAVIAELLLTGGLTVEGRLITGFQPLGPRDEIGADVLARLDRARKGRRLGLDAAVRQVPRAAAVRYFRERLVAEGVLTVERRRILLVPYRARIPVRATAGQEIADRIGAGLAAVAGRSGPSGRSGPDGRPEPEGRFGQEGRSGQEGRASGTAGAGLPERDRQLAGLLWAGQLDRRLYPGRQHAGLRKAAGQVAKDLPIAQAVRRVVSADNSGGG